MLRKLIVWVCLSFWMGSSMAEDDSDKTCISNAADCDSGEYRFALDPTIRKLIDGLPTDKLYINGTWVDSSSYASTSTTPLGPIEVVDPSGGQIIATVTVATQEDVDAATLAAREALPEWSIHTSIQKRQQLVRKLLSLYRQHREEMAQLISHEMGCPIELSRSAQVGSGEHIMQQFLHELQSGNFEPSYPLEQHHGEDTHIFMQPIGVVALITPWNWPMNQIALKVIPALLVGCTCILKPSEQTPLSAMLFADLIHRVGFPPGVFNLLNGLGPNQAGEWLSSHPQVNMVSFTGSTRGGAQVSLAAAPTHKRVSLEMGGKGANIIFDDIVGEEGSTNMFEEVIENGVYSVFGNSGQTCNAPTRMLVQTKHWDFALRVAKSAALECEVHSAHEEGDHLGPVVSLRQYERIQQFIQSGIDEGANLLVGGLGKPVGNEYKDGFYVRPTIFTDCTTNMTIMQEEIFGPVLCIAKFTTEEEAVQIANDSPYGLTNYVHSNDPSRRQRLAMTLESGMVVMNGVGLAGSAPFGGVKASGTSREGGYWGLEDYCIVKAVSGLQSDHTASSY